MDFSWTEKELSCRELLKSHVDFQTKGTQAPIIIFGPESTFLDQFFWTRKKRGSRKKAETEIQRPKISSTRTI